MGIWEGNDVYSPFGGAVSVSEGSKDGNIGIWEGNDVSDADGDIDIASEGSWEGNDVSGADGDIDIASEGSKEGDADSYRDGLSVSGIPVVGNIVGSREGKIDGGDDFGGVGEKVVNRDEGLKDGMSETKASGTKMVSLPSVVLPTTLSSTGWSACLHFGSLGLSLQNRLNCAALCNGKLSSCLDIRSSAAANDNTAIAQSAAITYRVMPFQNVTFVDALLNRFVLVVGVGVVATGVCLTYANHS